MNIVSQTSKQLLFDSIYNTIIFMNFNKLSDNITSNQIKIKGIKWISQVKLITRMNKTNIKLEDKHYFTVQELGRFIRQQNIGRERVIPKNILSSKAVVKNQSKSLHYSDNLCRNVRQNGQKSINLTGISIKPQHIALQTLNEQLLGVQKKKPATSEYKSGRNIHNRQVKQDTKNNRISLKSSSNYEKVASVAGVPLNQKQAKRRVQSYLNTKVNIRRSKLKQLQIQNQKIAKRLDSQQSQYSTKKILKDYQSHQKISRRLTESKLFRRSNNYPDDRSICSQNSSRTSGKSKQSQTSSIKSTSRVASSKSSSRNQGVNRFQLKPQHLKKVQIIEHNIHKINEDEVSKFKSLFANSFSIVRNSAQKNQPQSFNLHEQNLRKNPYRDIQVLFQKSQMSIKNKKYINQDHSCYPSIQGSNKKLGQVNFESQFSINQNSIKKSNAITSDGLLHRIAEEMYNKNSTDDVGSQVMRNKKQTNLAKKMTQFQRPSQKLKYLSQVNKEKRLIRDQKKHSIFPTHQIFSKF